MPIAVLWEKLTARATRPADIITLNEPPSFGTSFTFFHPPLSVETLKKITAGS